VILLVNGPNLNLLGEREPEVYGADTLADVERMVEQTCAAHGIDVRSFQSNSEGAILDFIQAHRHEARGIIVNPGALTHSSYALHDCLKAVRAPAVEVHVSNVHAREEWRRKSVISPAAKGVVAGLGVAGYRLAALWLCEWIANDAGRGEAVAAERARAAPAPRSQRGTSGRSAPPPVEGHEAAAGAWRDRAVEVADADGAPDEIPVDLTKRGDYEPL
jgi:3-dehydroquinate dehydratase-2